LSVDDRISDLGLNLWIRRRSMSEIEGVVETALYVNDLDQAKSFYHGVLGLPVIGKEPGRHVFFQVGGGHPGTTVGPR
jgi:catechol-2,3-dioxygenase